MSVMEFAHNLTLLNEHVNKELDEYLRKNN